MIRLQKYMAECGIASRRASEDIIAQGRVTVNGQPAAVGQSVEPGTDTILVDGQPAGRDQKVYIVLNKPAGTVTTAKDTHGRDTVLDCVHGLPERVFPIGRLDQDTEGVLLLTNDGELANRLLHPRYGVDKIYLARVWGRVRQDTLRALVAGVDLEDGHAAAVAAEIDNSFPHRDQATTCLQLTLREGRKREVKRLCEAVGHRVKHLKRVSFAGINTSGLRPGQWRYLSGIEIQMLQRKVGLR
jgi:23S rRNA pseudouridine2605 synthase